MICYSKIIRKLRCQTIVSKNRDRQSQQVIHSILACLLWYFVGIIPQLTVMTGSIVAQDFYGVSLLVSTRVLYFYGLTIGLLNSMANPLLYGIFNRKMRYVMIPPLY